MGELHEVQAEWQDGMHFLANPPGGEISIDAKEEFGGQGKGNRAKPLMLTSLAGCTGIDVMSIVNKMRLKIDRLNIEVKGQLTDDHPKVYKTTHVIYNFYGKDLDHEKLEKAVELSFNKYCGVITMFKSFSEVTKEINFIEG